MRTDQRIIFGTFHKSEGMGSIRSTDGERYEVLEIRPQQVPDNANVKALLVASERRGKRRAILLKVLEPNISLKGRVSRMLSDAQIPIDFSPDADREAKAFKDRISRGDHQNRLDLTDLALCTIDGDSAKDFDDAVFARRKGKNIEVLVAIADVSYYVKSDSCLDKEAASRATSIYFPGNCVPMLPEELSNGLCSLKPKVYRLAIAVGFEVGPKGGITRPKVSEAIIKSHARLTYHQVQDFYDSGEKSAPPAKNVATSLLCLREAAHALRKARERRGAIDFDIVESLVALDDEGEPISIHPQDRLDSHKMIEDLMVATNEIVADLFLKKGLPCLFRVHEPPDQEKLDNFFKTAHAFGALNRAVAKNPKSIAGPKDLQEVMKHYRQSRYKDALNTLMLRSMMQARYSAKNLMHFGLASRAYLHFTSPIRRYADLIVHRQLRHVLFEKKPSKKIAEQSMAELALHISDREVRATDLERKIDRVYQATFMVGHIGESFVGTIVACTEFGFFVRIALHHVEGLVHISTISPSHVSFIPDKMMLVVSGSDQRYMVGDEITVKLTNVNIDRAFIDFAIAKPKDDMRDERRRPRRPRRWRSKNNPAQRI